MKSLRLTVSASTENPIVGDLHIEGGRIPLISGTEATEQRIRARLETFLGEWFLDLREGVPYFERILIKSPDREVVRSIFTRVIESTPGIASLESLTIGPADSDRQATVEFVARLDTGEVLAVGSASPFIVEV